MLKKSRNIAVLSLCAMMFAVVEPAFALGKRTDSRGRYEAAVVAGGPLRGPLRGPWIGATVGSAVAGGGTAASFVAFGTTIGSVVPVVGILTGAAAGALIHLRLLGQRSEVFYLSEAEVLSLLD